MTRKHFVPTVAIVLMLTFGAFAAQAGTVTVIHGIDGSDLGLPMDLPVDINVSGLGCVLGDVPFGASATLEVPEGVYTVEIRLADGVSTCTGDIAIATQIEVNLLENSSVIAQLTDDFTITATQFVNDTRITAGGTGNGTAIVRHTADAPTVDVWALPPGGPPIALFTALSEGDQGKADVGASSYMVGLTAAGVHPSSIDDFVFGPVPLGIPADEVTIVYAVGSINTGSFTVLTQSID